MAHTQQNFKTKEKMLKKAAVVLAVLLSCSVVGCYTKSEGNRTGTIVKISTKGIIFDSYEGSMILGGSGSSGNSVNTWDFTVEDEKLRSKIEEAQIAQSVITVKYHEELFAAPWRSDTRYFIDSIK
jgi:hypothetical protein